MVITILTLFNTLINTLMVVSGIGGEGHVGNSCLRYSSTRSVPSIRRWLGGENSN